jgi:hypothetical protein
LYERRILEEEELIYHICQNILGTGKGKERANRKGGRKKTVYLDRANFLYMDLHIGSSKDEG